MRVEVGDWIMFKGGLWSTPFKLDIVTFIGKDAVMVASNVFIKSKDILEVRKPVTKERL